MPLSSRGGKCKGSVRAWSLFYQWPGSQHSGQKGNLVRTSITLSPAPLCFVQGAEVGSSGHGWVARLPPEGGTRLGTASPGRGEVL